MSAAAAPLTERRGIFLGLFAMLCFSIGDGLWKYALPAMSLPAVMGIGFMASATTLAIYTAITRSSVRPRRVSILFIYMALYGAEQLAFIAALGHLPMAPLFVIILTTPLAVLAGARFLLDEKLSLPQTASILSGFAGAVAVACLHAPAKAGAGPLAAPGLLFAAANVCFGSAKILFLRRFCRDENIFGLNLGGSAMIGIGALSVAAPRLLAMPGRDIALVVLSGVICAAGSMAYLRAAQLARAPLMAATQYSQMLWAALMGAFIFHEALTGATGAGIALIAASGFLLYISGRAKRATVQ